MTTTIDLLDAVQAKLRAAFSDWGYMEDLTRTNFKRPSFYCRLQPTELEDASRHTLHIKQGMEVVCFEVLQNSSSLVCEVRRLLDTQQRVLQLFAAGFLPVGDRALHITARAGELASDAATVVLEFDYYDDRPEETQEYAKMGDLQVTLNKEE